MNRDVHHEVDWGRRSFTLIEMLAVVVIMSMAASITAISLASADDASRLAQTGASLLEMDARARLHAQSLGEVVRLDFDEERTQCNLRPINGDLLDDVALPHGVTVELVVNNSPTVIVFDRLGQSADYAIILHSTAQTKQWRIAGLTGWIEAEESP